MSVPVAAGPGVPAAVVLRVRAADGTGAPPFTGAVSFRAAGPTGVPRPPRMTTEETVAARAAAAPGTWGNPLGLPALPNLPVPPAVVAAGFVAARASCWPRVLSLVPLAHPRERIGAKEEFAAFELLMEVTGHRSPGVETFARILCEYDGNRPELLRRVLRDNHASAWLLLPLPAGTELPFVRNAADWAFVTDFATRPSSLTTITFADETAGMEDFLGASPFFPANPSALGEYKTADRKARNLRLNTAPSPAERGGAGPVGGRPPVSPIWSDRYSVGAVHPCPVPRDSLGRPPAYRPCRPGRGGELRVGARRAFPPCYPSAGAAVGQATVCFAAVSLPDGRVAGGSRSGHAACTAGGEPEWARPP